jgi:hypothetical protein
VALVNHAKKEINAKIVYYGTAGCGKNSALTYIYSRIKPSLRGELKSTSTGTDNLLFFDFSPFEAALANGYRFRLHVYTLTGTVTNPATWKMTLKGTDGIVIMASPAPEHMAQTRECVSQLRNFLSVYGVGLHETPTVLQFNSNVQEEQQNDLAEMAAALELSSFATCRANSNSGEGLLEALATISRQVFDRVTAHEYQNDSGTQAPAPEEVPPVTQSVTTVATDAEKPLKPGPAPAIGQPTAQPLITLVSADIEVTGTNLKIPLEVHSGEFNRKIIVTMSITSEECHGKQNKTE